MPKADTFSPNLVQAVRPRYGLRFGPLAGYLGVSVSLLGMVAVGCRELPTAALLRRATERKNQLTNRQGDFDGVALTDNEFDKLRLTAALTETTTYLAEVAARKAALRS